MWRKIVSLVLLCAFLLSGQMFAAANTTEIPIIMYHKVTKDAGQWGKFAIAPWELQKDFTFLKENGYTPVLMQALIHYVHFGIALPEKPIVLTFDDGFFGDFHYVYPLAVTEEIPVVISVIGGECARYSEETRTDIIFPHLTWVQIAEMAGSGFVEVQNHSWDLHKTQQGAAGAKKRKGEDDTAYQSRLQADLLPLQDAIFTHTGKIPSTFTYPFGAKSDVSDEILKSLGFQASLMTENRFAKLSIGDTDSLFSLNRLIRPHGKSLEQILGK